MSDRYSLWLQQSLNTILNIRLKEDGDFGTNTRNALAAFRRRARLTSKGDLVCPDTEQALVTAGAGPAPGIVQLASESTPPGLTLYVDIPLQIRLGKAKSMTGIFIPDGFCPLPKVDLIVFLHGNKLRDHKPDFSIDRFWKLSQFLLREEVNKSGRNVILVAPTLGPVNQPGSLTCTGGFDKFLNEVLAALKQHGPYQGTQTMPSLGNIILACHSGSSWVMRTIVHGTDAAAKKIQECWAFEPHRMSNASKWRTWAQSGSQTKLYIYYIGGRAGEQFCKTLKGKALGTTARVTCAQNIFAEQTSAGHDSVPAAHLNDRIQGAPFLVTKSSCTGTRSSFVPRTRSRTLQTEVSPAQRTFVRDFSGPAGECDAGLARAGKTRTEALAIINQQIRIAIALLRNASASLTGARTSKTKEIFRKIFRVNPEFVPTWLKVTPTIKDRGDVVAVRCKRVADLLASGTIRYFCTINSTNCPDCKSNNPDRFACSSFGRHRVVCLGNSFWDAMKAGDTLGILDTLMHEPFHIFYGRYVTEHVTDRGRFGGVDCIVQFVFERNKRTAHSSTLDGCRAVAVRKEIGEFAFPTVVPQGLRWTPRGTPFGGFA